MSGKGSALLAAMFDKAITPRPDCLLWPGALERGYGRVWVDGKDHKAHRLAWELAKGPIPDELTVDHLCRIRSCINPEHMELVTHEENSRRGQASRTTSGPLRPKAPKPLTHCRKGHEFTPENELPDGPDRGRRCATCRAESRARQAKRRRELRAAQRQEAQARAA